MSTTSTRAGTLWAITSYFNPAGYQRRLANFRQFRERLAVPLVAVELAYGPDSQLKQGGQDVMWQKERLLNLALQSLPDGCKNVAALDCDVIFGTDDWPERATQALRRSVILQPYGLV